MTEGVVWDGTDLIRAFAVATDFLTANRDAIDALNVFPVPDGDTGTNMSLTMQAALDEARVIAGENPSVGSVAQRIAYGSLLGARGNSGVILSQIFRGFAKAVEHLDKIDGRDLANAMRNASDTAYKAVMKPVEGTMLTVIRVAAERAEQAAARDPTLIPVVEAALAGAQEALAHTPNLLETLRLAGVVDSGGQGVVLVLEAWAAAARGAEPDVQSLVSAASPAIDHVHEEHAAFGYCTNFMITGDSIPFELVRSDLAGMGQSAVIVSDERHVKVHLHTLNPGRALDFAIQYGELSQIKIENMGGQVERFTGRTEPGTSLPNSEARAVLAVASGVGIAEAFRSVGATAIVDGGQTMNPSIEELLQAVESTPAEEVIILPNDGNVLMAALQLPSLASKSVFVIQSRTIAQGLGAISAFRSDRPVDDILAAMNRAMARVRTVEISKADRDALVDGVQVRCGQFIGIIDERLRVAARDLLDATTESVRLAITPQSELVTIFTGAEISEETANELVARFATDLDNLEIEVVSGGQPHYHFIIAVE